jgi:hypothetical protein
MIFLLGLVLVAFWVSVVQIIEVAASVLSVLYQSSHLGNGVTSPKSQMPGLWQFSDSQEVWM